MGFNSMSSVSILFQSTLPVRGATQIRFIHILIQRFQSTLPVRGATDSYITRNVYSLLFQSTLPVRGATRIVYCVIIGRMIFQSTLPVRGATICLGIDIFFILISIHAPREGSDLMISPISQ